MLKVIWTKFNNCPYNNFLADYFGFDKIESLLLGNTIIWAALKAYVKRYVLVWLPKNFNLIPI